MSAFDDDEEPVDQFPYWRGFGAWFDRHMERMVMPSGQINAERLFEVTELVLEIPGEPPHITRPTPTIPHPPATQAPSSFISVHAAGGWGMVGVGRVM